MNRLIKDERYLQFLEIVLQKIQKARIDASQKVNQATIELYYSIGNLIVEKLMEYSWGNSVVELLAKDLEEIADSPVSFSERNLWLMKQLFVEYNKHDELLQYVFNIPWGQNIVIMQKIKDYDEKKYYLKATRGYSWGRTVLINQIKANAYQYHLENPKQHNFNETLPKHQSEQADKAMKSVYNLEMLGIDQPIHERRMELRMVDKIKDVLMELGYGFTFIRNQYKLKGNTKDYYIDLLFYHRGLRCLVAIELKTGEYKAEYAGKMNLYLNLLDQQTKMEDENPSIGIILCAEKDSFEVEFSLKGFQKPIGVAEYQLTKELPDKLKGKLPSASELKEHLRDKYGFDNGEKNVE